MNAVVVRELDAADVARRQTELAAFERGFVYPLGDERFRIDHGTDYLAFFRGLGQPHVFTAEVDGTLCGVLVLVRRQLAGRTVWYVCDWKTPRGSRGGSVARALLRATAATRVPAAAPLFGVSMDGAIARNRLARVAMRCPEAGPIRTTPLVLFSCDFATFCDLLPSLVAALGPIGLHTTHGTKDLVIERTGRPLPLLHVRRGGRTVAPQPSAVHMFCLPTTDPLAAHLMQTGLRPSATATVLHRHLDGMDWRELSTADI